MNNKITRINFILESKYVDDNKILKYLNEISNNTTSSKSSIIRAALLYLAERADEIKLNQKRRR